jgi:hypothetical protein
MAEIKKQYPNIGKAVRRMRRTAFFLELMIR